MNSDPVFHIKLQYQSKMNGLMTIHCYCVTLLTVGMCATVTVVVQLCDIKLVATYIIFMLKLGHNRILLSHDIIIL